MISKRVGNVSIFELIGALTGDLVKECTDLVKKQVAQNSTSGVLFNANELDQLDESAAEEMLRQAEKAPKSVFLSRNKVILDKIRKKAVGTRIKMLSDVDDATFIFSEEFVASTAMQAPLGDRRRHARLKAALPLHFCCELDDGQKLELFAVITNLSEAGLYAEFIEAKSEKAVLENIDVYDFRLLHLQIHKTKNKYFQLKGKLVRLDMKHVGVAIDFYEPEAESMKGLKEYLAKCTAVRYGTNITQQTGVRAKS